MSEKGLETENMDLVYFVREGENEELRYSLRSVAKNMKCRKVWIIGGKPEWANPDGYIKVAQIGNTKWDKVHNMLREACINPEISDDFILMNDDFFIMKPVTQITPMYRCSLYEHIVTVEMTYNNQINEYTQNLRQCVKNLLKAGKTLDSYELHVPMAFNSHKMLEILGAFPNARCTRSLYGNFFEIGGTKTDDVKVYKPDQEFDKKSTYLSTDDATWGANQELTKYIKDKLVEKCRFEK